MMVAAEIVEYTDPFCPWAWGTEPKLAQLRSELAGRIRWRRVLGVLLDGTEPPSVDEQLERWQAIAAYTGMSLPPRLERSPSTSRLAARAIKAAELQSHECGGALLRRLRESLFVDGRPAEDEEAILVVAAETQLDTAKLRADLHGEASRRAVEADWNETRRPLPDVIGLTEPEPHPGGAVPDGDLLRYRFPTVVVRASERYQVVPGWRPYETYLDAFAAVASDCVEIASP